MPLASVILAYHRVTPYLRPAVDSVLVQTERDLELVIVDDGAGAGLEPLGEAGRDPRIRLIRHPGNRGIPASHNDAVAAARGEFIVLLDHDDVALPSRVERQVAALRTDARLGLVSGAAETIDGDGRVTGREFSLSSPEAQRRYAEFAAPVVTPAYAGRREVFEKFPYRGEFGLTADFDFLARALEAHAAAGVPDVVLRYRRHAAQATQAQAARIEAERAVVRLLAARRRAGRPEGDDWRSWLREIAAHPPDPVDYLLAHARRCAGEGFAVQAAFHARRAVSLRRDARVVLRALQMFVGLWRRAGDQRAAARRMFLGGPVRALGLQPDA